MPGTEHSTQPYTLALLLRNLLKKISQLISFCKPRLPFVACVVADGLTPMIDGVKRYGYALLSQKLLIRIRGMHNPKGPRTQIIGLQGPITILLMVFGPRNPTIWVLGSLYSPHISPIYPPRTPLKGPHYLGP